MEFQAFGIGLTLAGGIVGTYSVVLGTAYCWKYLRNQRGLSSTPATAASVLAAVMLLAGLWIVFDAAAIFVVCRRRLFGHDDAEMA